MKTKIIAVAFALAFSASAVQAANIVQTAASTGKFNTLIAAAKAAGLAGALGHTKGITVFAPTDAAFAKLPKGTVASLLKRKNRHKLAAILKYHVVPGVIRSKDVRIRSAHVKTLKTKGDTTLRVRRRFGSVRVDNARVISADIKASNGIIHVVNKVLLPSS